MGTRRTPQGHQQEAFDRISDRYGHALLPYCLIALLPYCRIALLPYCRKNMKDENHASELTQEDKEGSAVEDAGVVLSFSEML